MKRKSILVLLLMFVLAFPSKAFSAQELEILSELPYTGDISQINLSVDHAKAIVELINENRWTDWGHYVVETVFDIAFFDAGNGIPGVFLLAKEKYPTSAHGDLWGDSFWWNGTELVSGGEGRVLSVGEGGVITSAEAYLGTNGSGMVPERYFTMSNGQKGQMFSYLVNFQGTIENYDSLSSEELVAEIKKPLSYYDQHNVIGTFTVDKSHIDVSPSSTSAHINCWIENGKTVSMTSHPEGILGLHVMGGSGGAFQTYGNYGDGFMALTQLHYYILLNTPTSPESDFTISNGVVTRYHGEGGYVVIPSSINGEKVTALGSQEVQINTHQPTEFGTLTTTSQQELGIFSGIVEACGDGTWQELAAARNDVTAVLVPDTVKLLKENVFYGSEVEAVLLQSGLETIQCDFSLAYKLNSIFVPETVTSIKDTPFYSEYEGKYVHVFGYNQTEAQRNALACGAPFTSLGDAPSGFSIHFPDTDFGYTTASPSSPYSEQIVSIYPHPDMGYAVKTVTATAADGATISVEYDPNSRTFYYTQPEMDVSIQVSYAKSYGIATFAPSNGNLFISLEEGAVGSRVVVYTRADDGYMVGEVVVTDQNGIEIPCGYDRVEDVYAFIQPESAVEVRVNYVEIGAETYPPIIVESEYGTCSVTVANPNANAMVELKITPNLGYLIQKVVITDSEGTDILSSLNENGNYEYVQPSSIVSIEVQYIYVADVVNQFTDITEDLWYTPYVAYVVEHGLMNGMEEGIFAPDGITTRGMVALILSKTSGEYIPKSQEQLFHDVELGLWYSDSIAWCKERGIVAGYDNGNFGVDDPITREQMLTIMYGFAKYNHLDIEIYYPERFATYADSPVVSPYAVSSFSWALGLNYIQLSSNELRPLNHASRSDFAQILNYFLEANHNTERVAMTSFSNLASLLGSLA